MTVTSTSAAPTVPAERGRGDVQPQPMAGFATVLRLVVRRDRVRMSVWVIAVLVIVVMGSASVIDLYDTPADLDQYARIAQADTAVKAMAGPGYGLDDPTSGAVVMNEVQLFTLVALALFAVFMVVRHTRDEEESGRAELVRAAPVGRQAALVSTMVWVGGCGVAMGTAITIGMVMLSLPVPGSVAFGAGCALLTLFFVGTTALVAQVVTTARLARAVSSGIILAAFLLRAVGDMGNGWLSWLSPIGWAQGVRAYADERWWALAVLAAVTAALIGGALALSARRDLGHGFIDPRPGPPTASPRLRTPLALALRQQRGIFVGWVAGIGALAAMMGLLADQADELMSNDAMAEMFAQMGGTPTDAFLATSVLSSGLIASGFAVSSVLALRSEELGLRAAPVLATPVSRRTWLLSALWVALVGNVVIMLSSGAIAGAAYAGATGDSEGAVAVLAASATMVPALWVMSAFTVFLFGVGARLALLGWVAVAYAALAGFLADIFDLPSGVRGLSPFEHVPAMPAEDFAATPVVALTAVAVLFVAAAVVTFDRRTVEGG